MKQKFSISRNTATNELIIREFSELDKDEFSLLSETKLAGTLIADAIATGLDGLIHLLRNQHLFPPRPYIEKIAAVAIQLFQDPQASTEPIDILLDDKENLETAQSEMPNVEELKEDTKEEVEAESDDIDNLLKDDTKIDPSKTPKVADAGSPESDSQG